MKILQFLKSRLGAVNISAGKTAGLTVVSGLVLMNIYGYMTDTPAAQQAKVRSLSSIMSSGGQLPSEYASMNFSLGNTQFATAEEVAARQGTLFDGGEGAVQALNSFSIPGYALGSGEAGLGMGANAASQIGPDGKPVTGNVSADGSVVGAAAAEQANKTKINKLGEAKEGGLKRASMARAGGSNLGSGSNGGFGASSRSSASAAPASLGTTEGYALSGAMPKGSTLLASNSEVRGVASSSSFGAGNAQSRIGSGVNSKEGKSLRDIALASSKVAANKNRSANEGTSPFMAREKLSGGVQVTGEGDLSAFEGSSTTEFEDDLNAQEGNVDQALTEIDTTEQEKAAHRSRLGKTMIALLFTTLGAMIAISALKKIPVWGNIAAYALGALMAVAIGLFIADAVKYGNKYGWDAAAWGFTIGGGLLATGIGLALFVPAVSKWINDITGKVLAKLGMPAVEGVANTAAVGVGTGISSAYEGVQSAIGTGEELANDNK